MTQQNKSHRIKYWLILLLVLVSLLAGVGLFMASPLFAVEQSNAIITLEAGKKPHFTPEDFLEGEDWCVRLSYLDTSSINHKQAGTYPVTIYHGFKRLTSTVEVVDTTAPKLSCNLKKITVAKGDYVTVNTLGIKAEDNTGIDRLLFQHIVAQKIHVDDTLEDAEHIEKLFLDGRQLWAREYTFEYGGIYTITVTAQDAYNNKTDLTLEITVEEPPVLTTSDEVYMTIGQTVDFRDYIEVWDYLDEDYSADDVHIDTSSLDTTKSGKYTVTYTATDSYGLASHSTTTVYLCTPAELQDMINTHVINKDQHIIIGAYNLYDSGYYKDNNPAHIQTVMKPSIVHIYNDDFDGYGSGFILKIDEDFVTIATNQHVVVGDYEPDIYFYDGTTCKAMVVATDAREDIAFLRIPVDGYSETMSLPFEYVETLRTVHINEGYWKSLGNASNITICYSCIDDKGEIRNSATGIMIYKEATRTWNEYEDINECIISPEPVPGTSGSAVFDGHGRLIAMLRGYTTYYTPDGNEYVETVAIPLIEILDYYQMVFHEKLQYQ